MIKQFVHQKSCLACYGCCRFAQPDTVWSPCLLREDTQQLAAHRILPSVAAVGHKLKVAYDKQQGVFICHFLNPVNNRCGIYAFRPFDCQLYPFLLNRRGRKIFLAVDPQCPGVGKQMKSMQFKRYIRYLTGLLRSPAFLETLRHNPQVMQTYAEAVDLAELQL
ncbi:MAG TPA: YkgJ family cysteine cluster protein [Patescibacteria group bacterium]|nr:YkgJ family cysteine cluster protein [Patescibacteria group bacterium]